jgi:hypothetical protein
MSGWNEQALLALAPGAWTPVSARAKTTEALPVRVRLLLLGAVGLLHLLVFAVLMPLLDRHRVFDEEEAILVDFVAPPPPPMQVVPNETITIRRPQPTSSPGSRVRPTRSTGPRPTDAPMQVVEAPPPRKLQLYNPDGSLRVPDDMLDELDKQFGDKRRFSYEIPHYDDAKKYFDRNPALVYEKTRFDESWAPDNGALTSLLEKAVEKTTKQVKVKVPGMNGSSHVVCTVAVLALSGTCRVITNGADWNGPQDDPDTLSPEEDRQCAAWWQKIIDAKTQDVWRATKELYEAECRKPLARKPSG